MISGGVFDSLPGQNGQKPPLILNDSREKSEGRRARSVEMITQRPVIGSLRRSGIADYFTQKTESPPRRRVLRLVLDPFQAIVHGVLDGGKSCARIRIRIFTFESGAFLQHVCG